MIKERFDVRLFDASKFSSFIFRTLIRPNELLTGRKIRKIKASAFSIPDLAFKPFQSQNVIFIGQFLIGQLTKSNFNLDGWL